MNITITIDVDNVAFGNSPDEEFVRALEDLIEETNTYGISDGTIKDLNGDTIGQVTVEDI